MKMFTVLISIIIGYSNLFAQNFSPEVHRNDSVWIQDVEIGIDNYVKFKIHLLKFKSQEIQHLTDNLDSTLISDLDDIDKLYITELNKFKIGYSEFMLRNQDKLYGYTYLDMVIEFEKFLVYPNIYGILLNPVRLNVNPKMDNSIKENSEILLNKILNSINKIQPEKLVKLRKLNLEFQKGIPKTFHRINQDGVTNEKRQKYKMVDFLILLNRMKPKN